ncbi:MAG: hypothetical protein FVQ77_10655 [Cytophagales bacterium]|nr:hypothetical protein [Cytophagales bacterium]
MKNFKISIISLILLVGATFFLAFSSVQDSKDKSLARVQKMSGKYVFINAEPVQEYDVTFELKIVAMGFDSPDDMSSKVMKKALKIAEKKNIDFDGVVLGSGKIDVAIKFKD